MTATLNQQRWAAIESLPMPSGLGDLEHGLCAVARIVYAATGNVSDQAPCIPPTIRAYMTRLNDSMLFAEHRHLLGTRDIAERVLASGHSPEAETRRALICPDYACRVFVPMWLRALGHAAWADECEALPPVTDRSTAFVAGKVLRKIRDAADTITEAESGAAAAGAAYMAAIYASLDDFEEYAALASATVCGSYNTAHPDESRTCVLASHGNQLRTAAMACLDDMLAA